MGSKGPCDPVCLGESGFRLLCGFGLRCLPFGPIESHSLAYGLSRSGGLGAALSNRACSLTRTGCLFGSPPVETPEFSFHFCNFCIDRNFAYFQCLECKFDNPFIHRSSLAELEESPISGSSQLRTHRVTYDRLSPYNKKKLNSLTNKSAIRALMYTLFVLRIGRGDRPVAPTGIEESASQVGLVAMRLSVSLVAKLIWPISP